MEMKLTRVQFPFTTAIMFLYITVKVVAELSERLAYLRVITCFELTMKIPIKQMKYRQSDNYVMMLHILGLNNSSFSDPNSNFTHRDHVMAKAVIFFAAFSQFFFFIITTYSTLIFF